MSLKGAVIAGLAVVLPVTVAEAKTDAVRPGAGDCTAAAEVVAHAQDMRVVSRSYATLMRCANAGGMLAAFWTTPPTDPERLALLRLRSASLSDRRILAAALSVVRSASTPAPIRRSALDVVLSQYKPSLAISSAMWDDPEHSGLSRRGHYRQLVGSEPVTAADRATVVTTFGSLAQAEAGTRWGRMFQRIAADLAGMS